MGEGEGGGDHVNNITNTWCIGVLRTTYCMPGTIYTVLRLLFSALVGGCCCGC